MRSKPEHYALSLNLGQLVILERPFRPWRLYANVNALNLVTINGIYVASQNELIQPFDAWFFSPTYAEQLWKQFVSEHGLTNQTSKQIQKYLDDNEISAPDPHRLMLPTIGTGTPIMITGTGESMSIILTGQALPPG